MSFPVKAIVLDWAGTMVDFGCMAPVRALIEVFGEDGFALTDAEARADMGKAKIDHLRAILAAPPVAERWAAAKGAPPAEADVERLYTRLVPAMQAAAAKASRLIPGAVEAVDALKALGIRIGSGTGYTREMMAPILSNAAAQGYAPELVVCAGETPSGRPAPFMTWQALIAMDCWPANACIKVDDAAVGIQEGKSAGCWAVGLAASGNGVGLDLDAFHALSEPERRQRIARSAKELETAGADYVIDDISQLPSIVRDIARRIGGAS
ncbi:MAG TPA: phosphonoacetaldehyde hydrolase [Caulobacteraceae bacterium]|jgi:phosphonoacetaldehyde hydrolase